MVSGENGSGIFSYHVAVKAAPADREHSLVVVQYVCLEGNQ